MMERRCFPRPFRCSCLSALKTSLSPGPTRPAAASLRLLVLIEKPDGGCQCAVAVPPLPSACRGAPPSGPEYGTLLAGYRNAAGHTNPCDFLSSYQMCIHNGIMVLTLAATTLLPQQGLPSKQAGALSESSCHASC